MSLPAPAPATVRALREYVEALEEEKRKMEVFQRELPLSLAFVSHAIDGYRRKMMEASEEEEEEDDDDDEVVGVHGSGRVLEELIPLRPATVVCFEERGAAEGQPEPGEKAEWLKSVQLWSAGEDDGAPPPHPPKDDSSGQVKNKGGGQNKKQRRCWSPDLHRRFVDALQRLGGPQAATPKQIREVMKVDDLTNDEVKSHLQKYRMHTRTPNHKQANDNTTCNPQATPPQVVLGIWVPPSKYASMPSATKCQPTQASEIYTSVSSLALGSNYSQQLHVPLKRKKKRQSNGSPRGHLQSESTMSSYSTATTGSF